MIRLKETIETTIPDDLSDYFKGYAFVSAEVLQRVVDVVRPQALKELSVTPGAPHHPIDWTSEKQRRAYFATDGFGAGIPYVRRQGPGNVQNAWMLTLMNTNNVIVLAFRNDDKAAKYVYGSLAASNPGGFQQRFHVQTGWLKGYTVVVHWMNVIGDRFHQELIQELGNYAPALSAGRRRAFTGRRVA